MFYSAIVFDFDGVIVESTDVKTAAFYELALPWGEEAAARLKAYHLSHFGVSRFAKFEWFFQNVLGKVLSASEAAVLSDKFTLLCGEKILASPLVPGFADAAALASERCPLYVASAAPQKELEQILQLRGLHGLFKEIYGSPAKKSEVLKNIACALGVGAQCLLMVGDSPWD
ncbi:MAG: HAD family hydrolase, partial [Desulfovibrionaceae bacterium]|nr:HAD family hydrolase [Desulfovibrionaceae bacterium]